MSKTREEKERAEFEAQMTRKTAALLDFARPYISRLTPHAREKFLELALNEAWSRRAAFAPEKASLLSWWDGVLRVTADSQAWNVIWYDGSVVAVEGKRLGHGEL